MERARSQKKRNAAVPQHEPLARQLERDERVGMGERKSRGKGERRAAARQRKNETFLSAADSEKILQQAREQQREVQGGDNAQQSQQQQQQQQQQVRAALFDEEDSGSEDALVGGEEAEPDYYEELEIDPADEAALAKFLQPAAQPMTLGDLIMEKIREAEAKNNAVAVEDVEARFNPQVLEVYQGVAKIMQFYTSGRLPKPFKIIPSLVNWEEVLYLTNPAKWSPAAMYQATRIFSSNLGPAGAQRFFNLILLPAVRDDIGEHKKLNYHYYQALIKAMYKPSAWFRGILLPLAEGGDCSLREAVIVGSVMAKMSIPPIHSLTTLLKLAKAAYYSGPISLFIRILLNKKYNLPYRVIDALVNHFLSFMGEHRALPVLWHQALLTFAQRYKEDITEEQKQAMKPLLKKHNHHLITKEIRRELFQSKARQRRLANGSDAMETAD